MLPAGGVPVKLWPVSQTATSAPAEPMATGLPPIGVGRELRWSANRREPCAVATSTSKPSCASASSAPSASGLTSRAWPSARTRPAPPSSL